MSEQDKKAESARVVGYFCQGFALLMIIGAIVFMLRDHSESGLILLIIGLCLLTIGIVTVAAGKRKSQPRL